MQQSPSRATRAVLVSLLGACVFASLAPVAAKAGADGRRVHVLHAFAGGANDGAYPSSGLARDAQGNLYGTTGQGGTYNDGTLYKIAPDGSYRVLHAFGKHRGGGAHPGGAPVILADGSLVGTAGRADGQSGSVVYKLSPSGHESVLHRFGADDRLGYQSWGLVADGGGNLYGTTSTGGPSNCGTAFRLHPDGTADLIYAFKGGAGDGCQGGDPMTFDAAGNLYGTTGGGAYMGGAAYRIAPDGTETILHMFGSGAQDDGVHPYGPVTLDAAGNLYGTTGSGSHTTSMGGTVYKIAADGTETVLQRFASGSGDSPSYPVGGVILDADGNLYGTTLYGGPGLAGIAFKLSPGGKLRILHAFYALDGALYGVSPLSVIFGDNGSLLGATQTGGAGQDGTVFKINLH